MSNLPKRMLINAKSSTTRNDSAKFDDLMWLLGETIPRVWTRVRVRVEDRVRLRVRLRVGFRVGF